MIQDFLQTMNDYLVVPDRVKQDGLGDDRTPLKPEALLQTTPPDQSPKKTPFLLLGEIISCKAGEELIARRSL